ncbi:extracellular solute-binding protein, partial [Streptomyces sp. MCAF7]
FVTGLQLLQLSNPSLAQSRPGWYGQVRDEKLTVGEVMIPYLRLYKTWLERGYLDKNALGLKYADAETDFLSGKSAMYVMGSWFTAAEAKAADKGFEVGVFPAPVDEGQRHPGPQGATMSMPYMILKDSGRRELALELVKWLVTDEKAVDTQLRQDGNFRRGSERTFSPLEGEIQKILDEAPASVAQGEGYGPEPHHVRERTGRDTMRIDRETGLTRRGRRSGVRGGGLATAIMVLPATVLYTGLLAVPVALAGYLSLTDWDGFSANPSVVGTANYTALLDDPDLRHSITVTLLLAGLGTVGLNVLGLGFALLLNGSSRVNAFFRMVLF